MPTTDTSRPTARRPARIWRSRYRCVRNSDSARAARNSASTDTGTSRARRTDRIASASKYRAATPASETSNSPANTTVPTQTRRETSQLRTVMSSRGGRCRFRFELVMILGQPRYRLQRRRSEYREHDEDEADHDERSDSQGNGASPGGPQSRGGRAGTLVVGRSPPTEWRRVVSPRHAQPYASARQKRCGCALGSRRRINSPRRETNAVEGRNGGVASAGGVNPAGTAVIAPRDRARPATAPARRRTPGR